MIIFYLITIIFFTTNVFSLIYSEGNRQSNSFMKMGKDYFKKLKTTRLKIFDKFRSLQTTGLFLVCTDVMAGGIDIADIEFDVPSSSTELSVVASELLVYGIAVQHSNIDQKIIYFIY